MRPCINERCCNHKDRCDPAACDSYVPSLASAALLALLVLVCGGCVMADAVSLTISGHSSGQGTQNLTFVGDLMSVNLSQNGTTWNITATAEGLV